MYVMSFSGLHGMKPEHPLIEIIEGYSLRIVQVLGQGLPVFSMDQWRGSGRGFQRFQLCAFLDRGWLCSAAGAWKEIWCLYGESMLN